MHVHAERGNDHVAGAVSDRSSRSRVGMPPGTLRVPLLRGRRRASRDACPRRAWERSGRGGCERSFLTLPRGNAARDAPRSASARRRRASRDACPRRAWERSGRGGCERSFLTLPRGNAARDAPRSASARRRRASRDACPRRAWERSNPHLPLCPPPGQNAQKIEQIGIFHCPRHLPNLDPNNSNHPDQGHNKND